MDPADVSDLLPVEAAAVRIAEAVEQCGRIRLGSLEALRAAIAAQKVFAAQD